VRLPGEDIAAGATVLARGRQLTPADLGLLASLGIAEVRVVRRLRVAFFSTGDELCSLGEIPREGQIYDSNRYTLHGMLCRLGVEIIDMGVVRDRREDIAAAFRQGAAVADVLLTSGGVSVGDADFVKETLDALGKVNFWKIAMKPGKPLAFGLLDRTAFFGLPGNPVSSMATFYQIVQPALRRLTGHQDQAPLRLRVPCASPLKKSAGRVDFQRGILEYDGAGQLSVRSTGPQGSHVLSSMSRANCFIILPAEWGNVEAGTTVEVEPFAGLI
jgi:molybdopterin molybdotransferase